MLRPAEFTPTFNAALSSRERRPLARITYCNLSWVAQEVVTGLVTPDSSFDLDEQGRRRIRLRVKNSDGSRTPDPTSDSWYGRFIVEWGLLTANGPEYVNLGYLVATSSGAQVTPSAGWASLGLDGPSALWGTFNTYFQIDGNTRIVDAITAIASDAGVPASMLVLYPTDEIVGAPVIAQPGDSRWETARRIAAAAQDVGLVLNLADGPDGRALLYPEVDPATATAPSWTFGRGDGITVTIDKTWDNRDFANHVLVYGGSGSSATIVSEIVDSSSGPYGTARRGDWTYKWPQGQEFDPLITTQARADARRNYLYRTRRTSQELLTVNGLVIPGFALSDVIRVSEPDVTRTNANYTLRGGYSFGLGPNGTMTLNVRRVVMP